MESNSFVLLLFLGAISVIALTADRQNRDSAMFVNAIEPDASSSSTSLKNNLRRNLSTIDPLTKPGSRWIVTDAGAANLIARHESCFVMVGRKAVMIGGRGQRNPNIYDPITRTWTFGAPPPNGIILHHMQCVVVDSKVWVVGAWTGGFPKERNVAKLYVYDPSTDIWSVKSGMPSTRRRGSSAAVAVGNDIYVLFGTIGGHETADHAKSYAWADKYNTITGKWTALADANYPRDHTGGSLMADGRICVAGGRDGGTIDPVKWPSIAVTECYNITSNTWSVEANIDVPRAGSAYGTSCDGRLLIAGGESWDEKKAFANFDVFDGTKWTSLPSLNIARHSSGGIAVDCICNALYIASGAGTNGAKPELYSVETFFLDGTGDKPC